MDRRLICRSWPWWAKFPRTGGSYGQIARLIGRERNARLVGRVLKQHQCTATIPLPPCGGPRRASGTHWPEQGFPAAGRHFGTRTMWTSNSYAIPAPDRCWEDTLASIAHQRQPSREAAPAALELARRAGGRGHRVRNRPGQQDQHLLQCLRRAKKTNRCVHDDTVSKVAEVQQADARSDRLPGVLRLPRRRHHLLMDRLFFSTP